jgi:diguanylate cyclase (GGDEF)-like protein/PAS domain S-box-containing protein
MRRFATISTPVLLGIAGLLLVLSVALVGYRTRQQLDLDARSQRVSVWYTTQALVEIHRLRRTMALAERGDADLGDVSERYEILLSRLPLLVEGEEAAARALAEQPDVVDAIVAALALIEPDIFAWTPAETALRTRIEAALEEADRLLTQLNLALHAERQGATLAARTHAAELNFVAIGGMAGLLTAAALVLVLLRRHARRALAAEAMLRGLLDALPVGVAAFDRDARVTLMNRSALDLLGFAAEADAIGRRASEVGEAAEAEIEIAEALLTGTALPPRETVVMRPDGSPRTLMVRTATMSGSGRLVRLVRVSIDITDQRRADNQARYLESHDQLTDLPNRMQLATRLAEALATLPPGGQLAVHCIDLDQFKQVNDSLGHAIGDQLLLAVAARIQRTLREGDVLARLGGDEFAVVQLHLANAAEAEALATRLCRALCQDYALGEHRVKGGASIGSAVAPADGGNAPTLLARADIALHAAKSAGRGRSMLFAAEQEAGLRERLAIEQGLRKALAERQLFLAYQPKFAVVDGRLHGCEALLRWRHPERGLISPGTFIPVAEAAGLMAELTRQVLDMACRQARAWHEAGMEVPVAVNLSGAQFGGGEAVAMVRRALDDSFCPPHLLEVEVTEGVFLQDQSAAAASFAKLRELGVRVSLDDFGTGFSSLGYLQNLRFDVIKIDRSFVAGIEQAGAGRRIVDAIVRLAHGLGAEVVAEGVETEAQLAALAALGCDLVQGFLLGRPMPAEELAVLARRPLSRAA